MLVPPVVLADASVGKETPSDGAGALAAAPVVARMAAATSASAKRPEVRMREPLRDIGFSFRCGSERRVAVRPCGGGDADTFRTSDAISCVVFLGPHPDRRRAAR